MHSGVLAARSQGHAIPENNWSGKNGNIDENLPAGDFAMPIYLSAEQGLTLI